MIRFWHSYNILRGQFYECQIQRITRIVFAVLSNPTFARKALRNEANVGFRTLD